VGGGKVYGLGKSYSLQSAVIKVMRNFKMGELIYLPGVSTLRLDEEKCIGCGMCEAVCPHAVFSLQHRKAVIGERDACMECGACARNCPTGAVEVEANVGCARAVINAMLGRQGNACCCVMETREKMPSAAAGKEKGGTGCC
jgi:NAD-dependent dihydropyrimidine dehydrogenase PreA subunit